MTEVALSSGCFTSHLERLANSGVQTIELSSHPADELGYILDILRQKSVRVLSVHSPCPTRGVVPNLAAKVEHWAATANSIRETMEVAHALQAKYIIIHAFYCMPGSLPCDDIERIGTLRRLFNKRGSIASYVTSEPYLLAKEQAKQNLSSLLPELKSKYPNQKIVLENLNPRIGYGGIQFQDVVDIAGQFDGDVGICLDIGHLTLSAVALERNMDETVHKANDLIWATHIHQNFAGRYCIDRYWNESVPQATLQEVDTHSPLLISYRKLVDVRSPSVMADNSAFDHVLEGTVQYTGDSGDEVVEGAVPVEHLLALIDGSAHRVFEFDSRYAPLDEILAEYDMARRGKHPVTL